MDGKRVILLKKEVFDVKIPHKKPLEIENLSEEQLNAALKKGLDDLNAGKISSADRVAERIQRDYDV